MQERCVCEREREKAREKRERDAARGVGTARSYGGFHHSLSHRKVRIHIANRQQRSIQEYSPALGRNACVFQESE